ncbi:UDP-N-acetylglucosamine 2-epimerase [Cyclobacteriaceae bacterium]|nr:UDP-N-acetylglucosamine 2-epimerase [Cyclobacteriaceae bacterium]MDB4316214.1 UDP-N-acetylglucosamine 2-epimerase [Cyclobacteriaceae bacterium]MDB4605749.1 UDP-N-acetylglucosamine 2-epimerase [Cyclobacteriaceae bacterium]|tara:strand:- start:915 stop:2075 length:1161 start_codon:yes stop_codon:yes gene_type:complete
MIKICVVTGTRAEYGLLYWTMKAIQVNSKTELSVCVTGMHLSPEFGMTYQQIEEDGFEIDGKVEMLLSSDTSVGVTKSMGLGLIGFADFYQRTRPDWVLVLGDRYEILSAVTAAMVARIPIAHCHGGETTEGVIDEAIRHSITKMSHLHFTSTNEYKNRVIQLGENPRRVFNVGALGIENINRIKLLSKIEFEKSIKFNLAELNFLVTFHPVTLEKETAEGQLRNLLLALENFPEAKIIFTKANADNDGRIINDILEDYVKKNPLNTVLFNSMGQVRYLSAIKHCQVVIGNSSSGLIEVPSFKKPTINIGDRQKGRIHAKSVISCGTDTIKIKNAVDLSLSTRFQNSLENEINPYGSGNASDKIISRIIQCPIDNILKKKFYNLES